MKPKYLTPNNGYWVYQRRVPEDVLGHPYWNNKRLWKQPLNLPVDSPTQDVLSRWQELHDLFEDALQKCLSGHEIDLVCLAGFMRILSADFVTPWLGRIINIHPSLLPAYKGLDTYARVLNDGGKTSGCTVHFVNEKLDSGKIIIKKKVYIYKDDNVEKLKKKVQSEEYRAYSSAIRRIYSLN